MRLELGRGRGGTAGKRPWAGGIAIAIAWMFSPVALGATGVADTMALKAVCSVAAKVARRLSLQAGWPSANGEVEASRLTSGLQAGNRTEYLGTGNGFAGYRCSC